MRIKLLELSGFLLTKTLLMKPYILLVDDDADDLMLLKDAIAKNSSLYELKEAWDGSQALTFLHAMKTEQLPSLIVLDINMPILDGRELLAIIKENVELKNIPVLFFTTSANPKDIEYAESFNVKLLTKPYSTTLLSEAAKKIISYCSA